MTRLCAAAALVSLAACAKHTVGLVDRACDAGNCAAGYACLDGVCRPFTESASAGAPCDEPFGVTPCVAGATDCSQGCRQCVTETWSECLYDCLVTERAFIRDESCNGRDDDCDGAVDESTDAPAGCFDRFLDRDGDGYGAGASRCACDGSGDGFVAFTADDCDDESAAIFPGAGDVCLACETIVATHHDDDGDGVHECGGDCNDTDGAVGPAVFEDVAAGNCHDGVDNDCSATSDCGDPNCDVEPARFRYGRVLTVTPQPTLAAGFGISFTFDHAALVAAARSLADGSDVRVFVRDGGGFHEVGREPDPTSGWNRAATTVWIRNERDRSAAESDVLLVYGAGPDVTTVAPAVSGVYAMRDDFDRRGPGLGLPWVIVGTQGISMFGGVIRLPGTNARADPYADRPFEPITGGRVELQFGITTVDNTETDYGTAIHLAGALPSIQGATQITTVGSAAVFGWGEFPGGAGPNIGQNRFFGLGGGYTSDFGAGTGFFHFRAVANLDTKVISTTINGLPVAGPTFGDAAVGTVSSVRIAGWQIGSSSILSYDYVAVRRVPPAEAVTSLGAELAIGPCP